MPSSSRARISNNAFVFWSKDPVQCLLLLEQRYPPLSATHRTWYIPNFPNVIKVHQSQTALKATAPQDSKFTSREASMFRIINQKPTQAPTRIQDYCPFLFVSTVLLKILPRVLNVIQEIAMTNLT